MGIPVNGWPANIHPHKRRVQGFKFFLVAGEGIVEIKALIHILEIQLPNLRQIFQINILIVFKRNLTSLSAWKIQDQKGLI
jgi:hypothetical protein